MIFAQYWQRFRKAWLVVIAVIAMLAVGVRLFDWGGFNPTCKARPSFDAGVDRTVQAQINYLYDNGLLYCADPSVPFQGLRSPIYWGSDGMSALLFFQADSLSGVGVSKLLYNDTYLPGPSGESPPPAYGEVRVGRTALLNQAPDEAATYFFRRDGAPLVDDAIVNIEINGPSVPRTPGAIGGRSVWGDVDRLWSAVTGSSSTRIDAGTARSIVALSFLSERWRNHVRRAAAEGFADADGRPSVTKLRDARLNGTLPPGPFVFQRASGAFGHSVWVANVVTATQPALLLVPTGAARSGAETGRSDPDGAIAPIATSLWRSNAMLVPLAVFAFDPLPVPAGTPLEARFWADGARHDRGAAPDHAWTVTFP